MFLFHDIFSKMNENVKESLQFLLLTSIVYQECEIIESYCVKLIILYTRGELSFWQVTLPVH